jgi:hypothetical protein
MEINIYAGIFLAELHSEHGTNAITLHSWPTSTFMIIFGLFLASFPDDNPHWMPWSQAIETAGGFITPVGGEVNRYIISLGTTFFVFGVFFSRDARRLYSTPFLNFLGRISFPIYLLHNTLIRTVLSWFLYQESIMINGLHPLDGDGNPGYYEIGGPFTFGVAMPLFYLLLIYVAHLWTVHVESRCEWVVSWLSKKAFGHTSNLEASKKSSSYGILST